jgi:phosphatidylinositol alpha-mannosyltransferase
VIPIGRSVIVPANGSLPNIILSPRSFYRIRAALERERFDILHLHEPMTPLPCVVTLAIATCPMVGTFHASGELGWMKIAKRTWGFLADRFDHRIVVSEKARATWERILPAEYELVPNGVLIPPAADPGGREHRIVFVGRQEPRKGLHVLLRVWPELRRRTGAELRVIGADPLAVRLMLARLRVSDDGIKILGFLDQEALTAELLAAKALVAPSVGGESFGMVLTRAYACALPVVASDIPGYREVLTPDAARTFPAEDGRALVEAVSELLADEDRRQAIGLAGRREAEERYSWDGIARRLVEIYEEITSRAGTTTLAAAR